MTPQEFADALVARLTAESTNAISFFAAGSVAPSSNVGPWLKDNTTWYVWNNILGSYVPQTIDTGSLGYVAQPLPAPDQTKYTFWIVLDGTGTATGIDYYSGGAWKDIYAGQFAAQTAATAALAAQVAAISGGGVVNFYPVAASVTNQTILVNTANTTITIQKYIDPAGVFNNSTSTFTAPVAGYYQISAYAQLDAGTSTYANLEATLSILRNGIAGLGSGTSGVNPGKRWYPQVSGMLTLSAGDAVTCAISANDGVNTGNVVVSNFVFDISLIQTA